MLSVADVRDVLTLNLDPEFPCGRHTVFRGVGLRVQHTLLSGIFGSTRKAKEQKSSTEETDA
jgi:hypothetical protein